MRSKMRRFHLQLLVVLVFCLSQFQGVWCENHDVDEVSTPAEKGKFYQTHVFGERPKGCSVVYSADASAMSSTWKSSDFRLLNDVYTTGAYFENKIYSAESPTIHIPTVTYSDRLFVCLEEMFEVENFYDYVSVEASSDFGKTCNKIYGRSGYTDGLVYDYTEIVGYSNKDVKFRLNLVSDSSYTASGFSLKNFEILLWQYDNYVTTPQLRGLDIDPDKEKVVDVDIKTPKLKELKIQDVIWEDQNEGIISFRTLDSEENFVPGSKINRNDIKVVIKKGNDKYTIDNANCFSWTNVKRRLDVALVVDFSGSMSTPITNMKNNLIKMCNDLDKKYDAMFSLARFGYTHSNLLEDNFIICEKENKKLYDAQTLESIIENLHTRGGSEHVYHAIDEMSKQTFYRANTTKMMIVLYNMEKNWCGCMDGGSCPHDDDSKIFNKRTYSEDGKIQYYSCDDDRIETYYDKDQIKKAVNGFTVFGIIYDQYGMGLLGDDYFGHFCTNAWPYDEEKMDFSPIFKEIGDILSERNYLKISPEFMDAVNLECGKEYEVSIVITPNKNENDKKSDIDTTKYSYPGYIIRSDETKNLDYGCVNSENENLTIHFSVDLGCDNEANGNPVVYYGYGNALDEKLNENKIKNENGIYSAEIPLQKGIGRINYRIEQALTDGKSSIVSPYQFSILNPYWTVFVCGNNSKVISIDKPVFSKCDKKERLEFSVETKLKVPEGSDIRTYNLKNYAMYLFYSFENKTNETKTHISEWSNVELKTSDGVTYFADQLLCADDKANSLNYFVVFRDTVNKIEIPYGNGNDDFKTVMFSDIKSGPCFDICNNISLSSHVLTEGDDILKFDIYHKSSNVKVILCDTMGNEIKSAEISTVNLNLDEPQEVSLISLLDLRKLELKYTVPYILVLKIDEKVNFMYVYLGRKKEQN